MKKLKSGKSILRVIMLLAVFVLAVGLQESKGAVITKGRIKIGVNSLGHLNTGVGETLNGTGGSVGIAYFWDGTELDTLDSGVGFYDGTSPGCLCEGWGVSGTEQGGVGSGSGYVNGKHTPAGVNLTSVSFTNPTAEKIISVTKLTAGPGLEVTQVYAPSVAAPFQLFEDRVTIKNTTANIIDDVRYVRVMDWDVPQNEFTEYSTIQGVGTTLSLERSHDGGFSVSDPLAVSGPSGLPIAPGNFGVKEFANHGNTINVDYFNEGGGLNGASGPGTDTGGYFRFNFGSLAAGATKEFSVFYGGAANETDMLVALQAVGIELFSLGNGSNDLSINPDFLPTYAFGFIDVEGQEIITVIPEPGTMILLGIGLVGLTYVGRKRLIKVKKN